MYSSLQLGDSSHKVTDLSANPVMRFYYTPRVLTVFCIGNEVFFISLYMLHFMLDLSATWKAWGLVAVATFPIAAMKHIIHGVQLILACQQLGRLDTINRLEKVK
ncbi:CDP-diacylglycerol--inositol 3-phosphatidyltransferase [Geodia barretti]|uniref:CDP-diacylglycerol--inositol 3-phosphatidyltransferase n=1 Tax=Geodia barretti TaxID=519541 RepID=A0AA35WSA1_GEOBA|nr:CDP-diacylglycerol--inositol 3-phosphatidyltransferase [Geodia barretti]